MKKRSLFIAALTALIAGRSVSAVVISIGAFKDNTLYEDSSGSLSNGLGEHFFAGRTAADTLRRGVIAFDVAGSVPAGATINSTSLKLNMSRCGPTCFTLAAMELHRLLADWGEGPSNAGAQEGGGDIAQPGDATWTNTFYPSSFWANPGGDYAGAISATRNVTNLGVYVWSSPQMSSDVQSWLNAGSNFGWLLLGGEGGGISAKRFDSKDSLVASTRPVLTIDYTPLPEPSTIFFVGGGMIAILRLRRR